jgi:hypothetical protein
MEVVAQQTPERSQWTTMLELMELEKNNNIGWTFKHWVIPSCPVQVYWVDF